MTTQLAPHSMSLPPPSLFELDLLDNDRAVGWIKGQTVGFRGFATQTEAMHAAWVAYRTLSRRVAQRHGGRPAPVDIEPLAISRDGDTVLASDRPIATLVRPSASSRSGPESFGFEIHVPVAADELAMRSKAYLMYRTLRKSGLRWAMWDKRAANPRRAPAGRQPIQAPGRETGRSTSAIAFVSKLVLAAIGIVMGAALIATAPRTVTIPIGAVLAAGLVTTGLLALVGPWRTARSERAARRRPAPASQATESRNKPRTGAERSDESMRELGWLALGVVSIAVLALALVVPDEIAITFAATGFAGLVAFRITAAWAGWVPHRTARAKSDPSLRRTATKSRNGTSPRPA